jgi:hypothetical protein
LTVVAGEFDLVSETERVLETDTVLVRDTVPDLVSETEIDLVLGFDDGIGERETVVLRVLVNDTDTVGLTVKGRVVGIPVLVIVTDTERVLTFDVGAGEAEIETVGLTVKGCVVGRPVFVIEYVEEEDTEIVGNVVAVIGVSEGITDFVRLGCLVVAKGLRLTEPDVVTVPVLNTDGALLTTPDAVVHTEPLTVRVGTNTVGEDDGSSVVDAT